MVGLRRAEGRDRLDRDRRPRGRAAVRRSAGRGAALVRGPHLDLRRHRVCGRRSSSARRSSRRASTIDVSGDGTNNAGRDVRHRARRGGGQGRHHQRPGDPERDARCRGIPSTPTRRAGWRSISATTSSAARASFVVAADGFESFGRAIIKKMIAEIALLPAGRTRAIAAGARRPHGADRKAPIKPQVRLFESFQLEPP